MGWAEVRRGDVDASWLRKGWQRRPVGVPVEGAAVKSEIGGAGLVWRPLCGCSRWRGSFPDQAFHNKAVRYMCLRDGRGRGAAVAGKLRGGLAVQ